MKLDIVNAIVPPEKLIEHWVECCDQETITEMILEVAQWGADEQLQLDARWVTMQLSNQMSGRRLIAEMRPTPVTLNMLARQMLDTIERDGRYLPEITDTIRRALEALPE